WIFPVPRLTSQAKALSPFNSCKANRTWSASKYSRTELNVLPKASQKLGSGMMLRTSRAMTTPSPSFLCALSTRRPKRHADDTKPADKATVAINVLPPTIKLGATADQEAGRVKKESKK